MPPVIGRAEQAYRRLDVRAARTPDAWDVRARLALAAARAWLLGWLGRHPGPVCGVPFGIWAGVRWVGWVAAQIDPSWATLGALLGVLLGRLHGWLAGAVVAEWQQPARVWLARRWAALWALLARLWRARVTHYRPRTSTRSLNRLRVVRDDQP